MAGELDDAVALELADEARGQRSEYTCRERALVAEYLGIVEVMNACEGVCGVSAECLHREEGAQCDLNLGDVARRAASQVEQ